MKRNKLLTLFAAAVMLFGVQSANAFTLTCLSGSSYGEGEGCQKLFDGTQDTKWGTWDGWYGNTVHTIFKATMPIAPTTYELVIANDTNGSTGRNWKKWKIYGGNFASDGAATKDAEGWVVLDEKDMELPTGQFEVVPLSLSAPDGVFYTYFKIVVEELRGGWGEYCQMDEFRFVDFTVDTSGAQLYLDFDYETGTDADLVSAYSAKKEALAAAIEAGDPDQIVPAVDAIVPIYNEIKALRNGDFIALDWTSSWGDGPGSNLVDKKDNTKWGGNFPGEGEHVQYVVFRAPSQKPYFYKLVTGGDTERWNTRNWKTWKVFGGNFASEAEAARSAEGWDVLDDREDISTDYLPNKNNYPATLNFTNGVTKAYSYYKVEVYASGGSQQQMSEIYLCSEEEFNAIRQGLIDELAEFADGLEDLAVTPDMEDSKEEFATKYEALQTLTNADELTIKYNELVALKEAIASSAAFVAGDRAVALDGNTAWGDNENWTKLVDGNIQTKWGGGIPEGGSYVIFRTYEAKTYNQYMLVTGNDTKNSPDRNWKNWKIYGIAGKVTDASATRENAAWTLLDQKTDIGQDRLPGANFAPAYFNFSEEWTKSYKYFKIEVEAAYNNGGSIQMSEFKMLTDEQYEEIRQEYVDSLVKVGTAIAEEYAGATVPDALKQQILAEGQVKAAAVTTAKADDLLPAFAAALNYITVEAPALIAAAQLEKVDGVYQIANAYNLASFAAVVNAGENDADAVVTADIDLADVITSDAWTSIGTNDVPYKGTFDGQGHTIKNITYTAKGQYNGLFGKLSTGATVKNFTAEGTMTVSTGVTGRAVALIAVAGEGGVLIQNINSKMKYLNQLAGAQVGGVLGGAHNGNTTVVDRCTYSGTLDGNDAGGSGNYGGLVGYANNNDACYLTISNCLFDGKLVNSAATPGNCTFGGMIGYSNGAHVTIQNVLSIGTVQSAIAAQFFGAVKSTRSTIHNSYYKGDVVNGSASTVTLNPCEATKVTDEELASGFVAAKLAPAFRQTLGTDAYPVLDDTKALVAEITDAGYATLFVEDVDLTVPEGVEAFAGVIDGKYLKLNAIEGAVAAGEPVVLKGAAGFYGFVPTTGATKAAANDLMGAAEDVEAAGNYILAKPEGEPVGFYRASAGTIKAGKAYLGVAAPGVKAFLFDEDGATGIANVEKTVENGAIYNIAGQRLNKMQKGINIVNGKKVLF